MAKRKELSGVVTFQVFYVKFKNGILSFVLHRIKKGGNVYILRGICLK